MTTFNADTTRDRTRLVLHIGFHKTGTSAIQEALYQIRVPLRDFGVVYPQPISEHFSHLDLASALDFNPRVDELTRHQPEAIIERYQRLIADSPAGATVIVSSEEFSEANWRPHAIDNLRDFLAPLDVELLIVAYARDPLRFLLSIYHHELRDTDRSLPFAEWVETFPVEAANFTARLDVWRQAFGTDARIVARDYEAIRSEGRSVVGDLLKVAGLDHVDLPIPERRINTGVHPKLVDPVIAVRRSDLDEEHKLHLIGQLFEVSDLMPSADGAILHLGEVGKTEMEARLQDLPVPQPIAMATDTENST